MGVLRNPASAPSVLMIRLIIAITLSTLALTPVFAQYQWRDTKGRMVFSEFPPPSSIAKSRIIKGLTLKPRPVQKAADEAAALAASDATDTLASANKTSKPTAPNADPIVASSASRLADRLAEYDKRRAEKLKAEKESDEKDKLAARQKDLCRNLNMDNRSLTSGRRLARINEKGEREIIDEKARITRLNENKELIAKHCAT
ncbi:MAG: DUF4124 domain-containing protein [Burkholderiaceae bacterium]